MSDTYSQQLTAETVKQAIKKGAPVSVTTYTLPHETEQYMNQVLVWYLNEINHPDFVDYLTYCTNELTTNAKKANTKRIYFQEKNLDINNESQYNEGMKSFKQDTLSNIQHYLAKQEEAGLYIKMVLHIIDNKIRLEVRNNSELTFFEYKRIHDKLMKVRQYSSMQDAFAQILDDSEGAGLGLIIMILMLQKVGFSAKNYGVNVVNGETIVDISFPLSTNLSTDDEFSELSAEIVNVIERLPHFPENITAINRLLNDPDSTLASIALHIANDISLTSDLLRLVNSASYGISKKCTSIEEAVKLIGIRGVRNLIFSLGSMKVLGTDTVEKKSIWKHSQEVAFYTNKLALLFCRSDKKLIADAYVCGLLHDIGKTIFCDTYPEVLKKMESIRTEKHIPEQFFEKLIGGSEHALIGMQIAQKWNFPEIISTTIRYHHMPEAAPEDVRKLTYVISLANMISHYNEGVVEFYHFDQKMLDLFKITDEDALRVIADKLKLDFATEGDVLI